jgi:hypothetical protein
LLQKDFAHPSNQHGLKIRRLRAMLIQKSIRPDSIVGRFYFQHVPELDLTQVKIVPQR